MKRLGILAPVSVLVLCASSIPADAQDIREVRTYHQDGSIERISHQGLFNGCGVPVGMDRVFDPSGNVIKTIAYRHSLQGSQECDDISTQQTITTYSPEGLRQSVQYYVGCYECEPRPTGNWRWYDSKGRLIRQERQAAIPQ